MAFFILPGLSTPPPLRLRKLGLLSVNTTRMSRSVTPNVNYAVVLSHASPACNLFPLHSGEVRPLRCLGRLETKPIAGYGQILCHLDAHPSRRPCTDSSSLSSNWNAGIIQPPPRRLGLGMSSGGLLPAIQYSRGLSNILSNQHQPVMIPGVGSYSYCHPHRRLTHWRFRPGLPSSVIQFSKEVKPPSFA